MAVTNFGALSSEEKTYWMRDVWTYMRNESFISRLMGKSTNAAIQHITKLTKTEKGTRALMFLVPELTERGVSNDNEREGNEEALQEYEIDINMGLISHQVKNKGKLSDQNHVISFRETARDRLKYWLAQAVDQMAFLTLSGVDYSYSLQGVDLGDNAWTELVFNGDVTAPSTGRHFYYDGTDLQPGDTSAITASCVPTYEMLVDLKAYAKTSHMKPLIMNGKENFLYVCDPRTLARLKKDGDFISALTQAGPRGMKSNPYFTGAMFTVDGIIIMEHNLVYNTSLATSGVAKWGAGSDVDGTRSLFLGAQALGFVDVGAPDWVEKDFDYGSKHGISIDKFVGFRKPYFDNPYTGNDDEDYGVIAVDLTL